MPGAAPLLGEDAVVREALADLGEDGGLALLVGLGDEVVLPFPPHLQLGIAEIAPHDLGPGPRGLLCGCEQVFVHGEAYYASSVPEPCFEP